MDNANFPGNSREARQGNVKKEEPKKVTRVTVGEVSRRKTPLSKRLRLLFVGGDAQSVGQYLLLDVVIPAFKDVIADVFSQGIEKMLYGEARSTSRRTGIRPSSAHGYVSYNRFSPSQNRDRRDERQPQVRRVRSSHDIGELILATRGEAEEVIDQMFELVSKYDVATVADLYELVGETPEFTDQNYGWSDLRGAGVTRISNGYLLDLPRPEPLER